MPEPFFAGVQQQRADAQDPGGVLEPVGLPIIPDAVLALVFERLPPGEQYVTVGQLDRDWRAWAANCRASLQGQVRSLYREHQRVAAYSLPLWFIQKAWGRLNAAQRDRAVERAARHGDVAALEWLYAAGGASSWGARICQAAAAGGHLEVLQWLRAQRPPCPWDVVACPMAAQGGHLEVLRWLRAQEPPCPWGKDTCTWAALNGHLEVLQWLRAQEPPSPWGEDTCTWAALNGHLEVLQWLRAQRPPCPWDEGACQAAAACGHLEVLQWLRAQQPPCPCYREVCQRVARAKGHLTLVEWMVTDWDCRHSHL